WVREPAWENGEPMASENKSAEDEQSQQALVVGYGRPPEHAFTTALARLCAALAATPGAAPEPRQQPGWPPRQQPRAGRPLSLHTTHWTGALMLDRPSRLYSMSHDGRGIAARTRR
ncbi:MAG TPA: hypothetical protein VGF32_30570, partial [Streptosporangiaceae bacterium]